MDYQAGFNILVLIIGGLMGWALSNLRDSFNNLSTADKALMEKVQAVEVLVAGTYVKRDELERVYTALFLKLDRIEEKLDGKVDK